MTELVVLTVSDIMTTLSCTKRQAMRTMRVLGAFEIAPGKPRLHGGVLGDFMALPMAERLRRIPGPKLGHIYALRAPELSIIKIGYSENPRLRVKQHLNTLPFDLTELLCVPASQAQEVMIHAMLSRHRKSGEWYMECQDVQGVLEALEGAAL
jgi:hypothetical protein